MSISSGDQDTDQDLGTRVGETRPQVLLIRLSLLVKAP